MSDAPPIVRTAKDLRAAIAAWRREGCDVAVVPTMGALHAGHLALIERARAEAARVCVTLFVNPTQFGPNEDFDRYPRDEAGDAAKLAAAGAHLLFAPERTAIYAAGEATRVSVPGLGDILEGAHRPGFFTGVATVVAKLLALTTADVAIFGEKDYQQLRVVTRMAADLFLPTRIVGAPTVREADGLALSSRNAYLSAEERAVAPALHRALQTLARDVAAGADPLVRAEAAAEAIRAAGFASVDYVEVRDAESLEAWGGPPRPARILAAARLGRTRLIDNVAVPVA